jgi:hypothetical protein
MENFVCQEAGEKDYRCVGLVSNTRGPKNDVYYLTAYVTQPRH